MMHKIFFLFGFLFCYNSFSQVNEVKNDSIKIWDVSGKLTFLFNQASFSNWAAGGENSVSGTFNVNYDFNYEKGKWKWDNKIIANYGLSYVDKQGLRKTSDHFEYNSILGLQISKHRYFSFFSNFKTQFSIGYDYKKVPEEEISNIFAPAYWTFGPGFLWKKSANLYVNIAPSTARFTFVSDKFSGRYGVEKGKNSLLGWGFNISGYYKFKVMENVYMENILSLYSDYFDKPENIISDYQINFNVIANKYLTMNLGLHAIMDVNASKRLQFKEVFGLGFNYLFPKK